MKQFWVLPWPLAELTYPVTTQIQAAPAHQKPVLLLHHLLGFQPPHHYTLVLLPALTGKISISLVDSSSSSAYFLPFTTIDHNSCPSFCLVPRPHPFRDILGPCFTPSPACTTVEANPQVVSSGEQAKESHQFMPGDTWVPHSPPHRLPCTRGPGTALHAPFQPTSYSQPTHPPWPFCSAASSHSWAGSLTLFPFLLLI